MMAKIKIQKFEAKTPRYIFIPFSFGRWRSQNRRKIIMRYQIYEYKDNKLTPIMPFMHDGEISADSINQALHNMYKKMHVLPPGTSSMPKSADNVLLLEYGDYFTYKPQPIPDIAQFASGYTGCVASFKIVDGRLTDMREPSKDEIESSENWHKWYFVPKAKRKRKTKTEETEGENENERYNIE